jgi:hypothetical protein
MILWDSTRTETNEYPSHNDSAGKIKISIYAEGSPNLCKSTDRDTKAAVVGRL